jgi:hypothetical protein
MKIPERTGKWVEMAKSADSGDEITVQVPSGIWVGLLSPLFFKQDDLATFLRSVGWHVVLPESAKRAA